MGELSRAERLQIMLSQSELRVIDTWRFTKRMPSRASAIRELLRRGLAAEGFLEAEEGQKSKNFSVLE
jgi:metal-responsive CopG/Arc/MetJ family transcriptional regulator